MYPGKLLSLTPLYYPRWLVDSELRFPEFERLLRVLIVSATGWVKKKKDAVSAGYLVFKPEELVFYVIARSEKYDFNLASELSEFSVQLADKQGINLNTRLLPRSTPEELSSYVDLEGIDVIPISAE